MDPDVRLEIAVCDRMSRQLRRLRWRIRLLWFRAWLRRLTGGNRGR